MGVAGKLKDKVFTISELHRKDAHRLPSKPLSGPQLNLKKRFRINGSFSIGISGIRSFGVTPIDQPNYTHPVYFLCGMKAIIIEESTNKRPKALPKKTFDRTNLSREELELVAFTLNVLSTQSDKIITPPLLNTYHTSRFYNDTHYIDFGGKCKVYKKYKGWKPNSEKLKNEPTG